MLVAGNWKMNGSMQKNKQLLDDIKLNVAAVGTTELAVFPPFVYLQQCMDQLKDSEIAWGAQNISEHDNGAFTGEVSATMLNDLKCRYVIIGHSERRSLYAESNETITEKFKKAIEHNICPIICVGESLNERKQGITIKIVKEQLAQILTLQDNRPAFDDFVIAYEPVWAIGTGETASPEQAQEVHAAIRQELYHIDKALADKTRILYGGSVNPSNAESLLSMPDIDGGLIGGASLKAEQFIEIGRLCNQ